MILIAAVDENWAIGKDSEQFFRLKADLARFRALTLGKTVIVGRKTLATFPGGKPLPGRENLILSASLSLSAKEARVFSSLQSLLAYAPSDSVVIGGGSVYKALLPYCDTAYITKIHGAFPADTWIPNLDALPDWRVSEESPPVSENGVVYHYVTYTRV